MTNSVCQLSGFLMTLLAGFVVIAAIAMPFWIRPVVVESNDTEQQSYYGLWSKCTEDSTQSTTCDRYQNIFIKGARTSISEHSKTRIALNHREYHQLAADSNGLLRTYYSRLI